VIDVRFTPDATKLLRSSEMTRCANTGYAVAFGQRSYVPQGNIAANFQTGERSNTPGVPDD
jgi:hypothetical protein